MHGGGAGPEALFPRVFVEEPDVLAARHIQNAFAEGELDRATSLQILQTSPGAKGRPITLYNLDVIISVGYRVKSKRGTQFRIWANGVLRDHLLRGYTLNEKRLLARGVEFDQAVALLTATLRKNEALTPEGQARRGMGRPGWTHSRAAIAGTHS